MMFQLISVCAVFALSLMFAPLAHAVDKLVDGFGSEIAMDPVGKHYRLFEFDKNVNPQNVLIAFTKLNDACEFVRVGGKPLLDYYWLMDGAKYKKLNAVIHSNVDERLSFIYLSASNFRLRLNDVGELKSDLKEITLEVRAKRSGSKNPDNKCEIATIARLTTDKSRDVKLKILKSDSEMTILPPFQKLVAMTVIGEDVTTGKPVSQTFKSH